MKPSHRIGALALSGAALALFSCAPTGGRSPSGFLANFAQLNAGYGTTDAVSAYIKPGADLKPYDSVLIEPVTTVIATQGISPQVSSQLAAYLGESLRSQVAGKLKLAAVPGPKTLRVRMALTDVLEKSPAGSPVTTVQTSPKVTLSGNLGSPALAAFITKVSFEGEILDSVTGERLCALCDHRIGAKREATAATSWAAVRTASQQGAARLYQRFLAAKTR